MILLPNQLFFAEVEAMLAEGREVLGDAQVGVDAQLLGCVSD